MIIKIENLCKSYKVKKEKINVLNDFNMEIKEGEFISIVGASGCGKSTLLRILGCLDNFDSGNYILDGVAIKKQKVSTLAKIRNEKLGFVFQNFSLIPEYTVFENIEMPLGYNGINKKEREKRVLKLLEQFNLLDKKDLYPNMLSGGQQQRIAIIRAIVNEPKIILADEPTGNLDSNNLKYIMDTFKEINKNNVTIIVVTHDKVTSEYADRIIEIREG